MFKVGDRVVNVSADRNYHGTVSTSTGLLDDVVVPVRYDEDDEHYTDYSHISNLVLEVVFYSEVYQILNKKSK